MKKALRMPSRNSRKQQANCTGSTAALAPLAPYSLKIEAAEHLYIAQEAVRNAKRSTEAGR